MSPHSVLALIRMQLNLQFGNIPLRFLVHSPSLAQAGQLGLESLIL